MAGFVDSSGKGVPEEIAPGGAKMIDISKIGNISEARAKILTPTKTIISPIRNSVLSIFDDGKYFWTSG